MRRIDEDHAFYDSVLSPDAPSLHVINGWSFPHVWPAAVALMRGHLLRVGEMEAQLQPDGMVHVRHGAAVVVRDAYDAALILAAVSWQGCGFAGEDALATESADLARAVSDWGYRACELPEGA